jgi:NADPH:quinone reductase-like Zn-dependent oxidoreductase
MKAVVYTEYGPPEVLQLKEVDKPTPKDDEVLIKIHAAAVTAGDVIVMKGEPLVTRLMTGLLKPKNTIPGKEMAGRVEAVGGNVTQFQPGDEVYGDLSVAGWGAFAE